MSASPAVWPRLAFLFACALLLVQVRSSSVTYTIYANSLTCISNSSYETSNTTAQKSNGDYATGCLTGPTGSFILVCSSSSSSYQFDLFNDTACASPSGIYASTSGNCDPVTNNPNYNSSLLVTCYNNQQPQTVKMDLILHLALLVLAMAAVMYR